MFGVSVAAAHITNMWNKKPYYFGWDLIHFILFWRLALFPRMVAIAAVTALGYGMGSLRERHYQTRDAVIQHYMELHPEDFDHFQDSEFSLVL